MSGLQAPIYCLLLLSGCFLANSPPTYRTDARVFLESQQVDADLVTRLVDAKPLSATEADRLSRFDHVPVLHLLGGNESIPGELIEKLARHPDEEVRTGVASNPGAPLQILLGLRTPGQYSTLNEYLAQNPQIPPEILREMEKSGEASLLSLGMNPNCPPDLMAKVADQGDELARTWLARNPNLPAALIRQLEKDPSEMIRSALRDNPKYLELSPEDSPGSAP